VAPNHFERDVLSRLELGARTYGDDDFTRNGGKDCIQEAMAESLDQAAYALLESQRLRGLIAQDAWEEMNGMLTSVIASAANTHAMLQRAAHRRQEFLGG
jgi:hypothetical protein